MANNTRGGCVRKAWKPSSSRPILIYFEFRSKPLLITVICMDPHSPNKLFATKYSFLILVDDTSFFFFISFIYFFFFFVIINFYKNHFIIVFFMFRDFPECSSLFRHVPECSVFLVLSTPFQFPISGAIWTLKISSPSVTGFYGVKQTFRCTLSKILDLRFCACIFNIPLSFGTHMYIVGTWPSSRRFSLIPFIR